MNYFTSGVICGFVFILIFNAARTQKSNTMLTNNRKLHAIIVQNVNNEKYNMFLVALHISSNISEGKVTGKVINLPIFTEATVVNEFGNYCYMPSNIAMALFQSKDYTFKVVDVPDNRINGMMADLTYIKAYGTIKEVNEYINKIYEQIAKE